MGIDSGRRLFRQIPAQMMKQQSLLFFGFSDARQTEMAAVTQAEPDFTIRMERRLSKARAGVMDSATTLSFCLRQTHKQ